MSDRIFVISSTTHPFAVYVAINLVRFGVDRCDGSTYTASVSPSA